MNSPRLTSIDIDGWTLVDAEAAHAQAPSTFWIPSLADRTSLRRGDMAKMVLCIRVADKNGNVFDERKRMWVWITDDQEDWYRGELDNQPCCTDDMSPGFEVWFQAMHVIDVIRFEDIPPEARRFDSKSGMLECRQEGRCA